MSRLEILKTPNPILRAKNAKIGAITPELKRLVLDMAETMKANDGVGLAAPQVGQNIRLVVINTADGFFNMVNPRILWHSFGKEIEEEGCLSCPGIYGRVKRSKSVWVLTKNENGKYLFFKARGFFARVIQHELDHLDGILIVDKIKKGNHVIAF